MSSTTVSRKPQKCEEDEDLSDNHSPEETEILQNFLFQLGNDEEDDKEELNANSNDVEVENDEEEYFEGRNRRAVSVWANQFTLNPTPFEGLPIREDTEPDSAIFRFVKKNNTELQAIGTALTAVSIRDNNYRGKIFIQRDVPYLEEDDGLYKHKLDIYFPEGAGVTVHNLPLVIHFHGGGWVRGDRRDEFRGAPAVCRHYSSHGIIAVAPSYRLVDCPGHMTDAVAAVKWTVKHLSKLGANPDAIFVSGHSAGGNIAANLVCGTWVDSILEKYNVSIIGAVCISGVYSLLNPLGGSYARIKNKGFDKLYRLRVFGEDLKVLVRHSPVAQLRMILGELPYPVDQCKLCNLATAISQWICPKTRCNTQKSISNPSETCDEEPEEIKSADKISAAFLIMNASSDLGLDVDGQRFVELLERIQTVKPRYHILPNLGHATITLEQDALIMASDFIHEIFLSRILH